MPTLNAAARNFMATASGNIAGGGMLQILDGSQTILAEHSFAGFGSPSDGVINANVIADETILDSGLPASAKLVEAGREVTLSVGIAGSGAEVILPDDGQGNIQQYVQGGNSSINSVTITYPAS